MLIVGWDKFQGYQKRGPAWIKLHVGLLDQPQYLGLPIVARAVLPALWITAARTSEKGELPDDLRLLSVLTHLPESELLAALEPLRSSGFVACDESVARPATNPSGEERRERGEREREIPPAFHVPDPERPQLEVEAMRLARSIAELRDPTSKLAGLDASGVMREFTAFKGQGGVVNPATISSKERLQHAVLNMRAEVARLEAEAQPAKPEPTGPQFFGVRKLA